MNKQNIISFSGGKDSTAMLLMMLERNIKVDKIIMFDTGWEFPQMIEHVKQVEKYIQRPITILQDKKGFDYWLGEHIKTRGKNKGQTGYGFPDFRNRWCTALKRDNIKRYLKDIDYTDHQGIAFDELHRITNNQKRDIIYPLIDWQITEKQALEYCYYKGFFWGGLYEKFVRVSCFCCPLQRISELKVIYNEFPKLWQKMREMDKKSYRTFRSDYTLEQLEIKFKS